MDGRGGAGTPRRVLLRSAKQPWDVVSPGRAMRRNMFRTNTGNLVFGYAAHRSLLTSRTAVNADQFRAGPADADRINNEYDAFVIPMANAFRLSFAEVLGRLADLVERLRIPVVVLGIGAQTGLDYNTDRLAPIEDTVKRFVGAVLDRSASIGVRGELTATYLHRLGFSAVEVIGCPAMFMWGDAVPLRDKLPEFGVEAKVSLGVSPYVTAVGGVVRHHVAAYPDLTYLPQDLPTLRLMMRGAPHGQATGRPDVPVPAFAPALRRGQGAVLHRGVAVAGPPAHP